MEIYKEHSTGLREAPVYENFTKTFTSCTTCRYYYCMWIMYLCISIDKTLTIDNYCAVSEKHNIPAKTLSRKHVFSPSTPEIFHYPSWMRPQTKLRNSFLLRLVLFHCFSFKHPYPQELCCNKSRHVKEERKGPSTGIRFDEQSPSSVLPS